MKKLLLTTISAIALANGFAQTIEKTCYRGAFAPAPTPMWTDTWTEWDPKAKVYPAPTVTITTDITTNTTWSTGQVVLLSKTVYVKQNAILTIQPGVVVLGNKSVAGAAIVVTKGSQLIANGTVSQPIVFTSNQAPGLRAVGDWGGIIMLGKATNNNSNGVGNIEGLPISVDSEYGGGTSPDDNDNSGSLKYVRIEFGGYQYQPNQEINALTMGAVGRNTVIDYVQTSYTNDDAFEWFAGTVNCKHLVSFRNVDDDFDTDYGFSGSVQFCLAVRDPDLADNPSVSTSEIFESDNNPTGTAATPVTAGIFCNVTAIGPLRGSVTNTASAGHRRGLRIRRNSSLKVFNSIFMDNATRGLFIDGSASETNASTGALKFKNNILAGYGQRATESGTFGIINANAFVAANANDTLKSSANILTTPYNYTSPDYRPSAGSLALSNVSFTDAALAAVTGTSANVTAVYFAPTACIGTNSAALTAYTFAASSTVAPAYCALTWSASPGLTISSTTAMNPTFTVSTLGTFTAFLTVTDGNGTNTGMATITTTTCLDVNVDQLDRKVRAIGLYPNPSQEASTLSVNAHGNDVLTVNVYDLTGKMVLAPVQNQSISAGDNKFTIVTKDLNNGIYFVTLNTSNGKETVKLVVNK